MVIEDITEERLAGADIRVIGVGGGGGNAVNTMVDSRLEKVKFITANTDAQALERSKAHIKLHLGRETTEGLGAGGDPTIGKKSALESEELIMRVLEGADMVFVTAGMGGGTGTGASPIIANIARELGALTVAVVTKPFAFEARKRMQAAELGIEELRTAVDTLIVIPNQSILGTVNRTTTFSAAFRVADDVLLKAIQGISDLINVHGLVNLDFADVKTTMLNSGMAIMGTGHGRGSNKALEAVENAIYSPLLENTSIKGAHGILINIMGGPDLSMFDVNEASMKIFEHAHDEANIIWGAVIDENMEDEMQVTIIATRFEDEMDLRKSGSGKVTTLYPQRAGRTINDVSRRTIVNHGDWSPRRTPATAHRAPTDSGIPAGTKDTPAILRQGPD
jgi:cell division protein FtsZ